MNKLCWQSYINLFSDATFLYDGKLLKNTVRRDNDIVPPDTGYGVSIPANYEQ